MRAQHFKFTESRESARDALLCGAPLVFDSRSRRRCIALHPALCLNIYICLKPDTPRHAVRFIPQRSLCLTEEQSGDDDDDAGQMATLIGYKKQSGLFHFTCISQEIEARSAAGQPQLTKHGRRFILICLALPPDATYDVLTIYWFPRVLVADENNAHWHGRALPACIFSLSAMRVCACWAELLPFLAFYSMNLQCCMKSPRAPVNK